MTPIYLALLDDNKTLIDKTSLELINAIPEKIKYLVKVELNRHVKIGQNEDDLYSYTSVDLNGQAKVLELTNFIVIDLGTDYFGKYASERYTTIKEKRTNEIRKFPSGGSYLQFVPYFLAQLLRKLENAGSWEVFDMFKELEEMKKENEQLRSNIKELTRKLESLGQQA